MRQRLIVINFKTYKQGKGVVKLAKIIEDVNKKIIIGVQASDIKEVKEATRLKVYVQHVDFQDVGRNTGFILPEAVKKDGASGTFLNHSEHRLEFDVLKKTVQRCKKVGLKTMIFAGDLKEAKKIKKLKPDYIIIEPSELVGGKTSVSEARPELIRKIRKELGAGFLVGAGIHSLEDIRTAMNLGAWGVAISSAITMSKDPKRALKGLLG